MIIVLKPNISESQRNKVVKKVLELGFKPHISQGVQRTIIGMIGERAERFRDIFERMPEVDFCREIQKPYKLVSREFKQEDSLIKVNGVEIGGERVVVISGPCVVERKEVSLSIAKEVKKGGARIFQGNIFKLPGSPYSFRGVGKEGIRCLLEVKRKTSLPILTEVMSPSQLEMVKTWADIIQIGAHNIQNFSLLKEVGWTKKPVLLKRGMATTIRELLLSAEYIMSQGNHQVILCEQGIRTFEDSVQFILDLNSVAILQEESHLPVFVDLSHGMGKRELVSPMAKAAIACGADGLVIEVHPDPENALSGGVHSLLPGEFAKLMEKLKLLAQVMGKDI